MSPKPTLAQLLRHIAQHEALEKTRAFFPRLSGKQLQALLWQAASSLEAEPTLALEPMPEVLSPPKEGPRSFIRIYSDGASRGNPGPAGAGALLEGEDGEVLERLGRYLGEKTNNQAEYEGALLGLRRARALGATSIELLADSQLLIRQLQGRYRVQNPGLVPLYREALQLLAPFSKVRLLHIPREKNQGADEMSNRAIDERLGFE